jgi:hypothetical protein
MNRHEEEWAKAFEGKDASEIWGVALPPNLSNAQCDRFRSLQAEAARKARSSKGHALLQKAVAEVGVAARPNPIAETTPAYELAEAEPVPGRQVAPAEPRIPLKIPNARTDVLLDKQIASCAGIIEHLAHYIGRYDTAVETCTKFMERIGLLMKSSSEAALAAGRLRGMAPEGRPRR